MIMLDSMLFTDVFENLTTLINTNVKEVNLDKAQYALAKEYDEMGIMHIIVYHDGERLYGVINGFETLKDLALCLVQMNTLYCCLR